VLVGATNAVNLTDGLDGLAISTFAIVAAAFTALAYVTGHRILADYLLLVRFPPAGELTIFCGALVGASLGFLWYNAHPAEIFMGDVGSLALGAALGIVAPDGREGMLQHARECAASGVPFLFDPGQGLPMFSKEELDEMVRLADYLAVNDYEGRLLVEKTGRTLEAIAKDLKALVATQGAQGSVIHAAGRRFEIPAVAADALLDPTGCGDAYRAGLLYGIAKGWDWERTGRLASVMGSIKIAHRGGQNHKPTREDIASRYKKAFGASPF